MNAVYRFKCKVATISRQFCEFPVWLKRFIPVESLSFIKTGTVNRATDFDHDTKSTLNRHIT